MEQEKNFFSATVGIVMIVIVIVNIFIVIIVAYW